MEVAGKVFDEDQFHDCFILSLDFSKWRQEISMLFWCPNAGEVWEDGRYLQIHFRHLLFWGFEAATLSGPASRPVFVTDIFLDQDSAEVNSWRERLEDMDTGNQRHPRVDNKRKVVELYHFVFDSNSFGARAFLPGQVGTRGLQILCGDFVVADVTDEMSRDAPKYDPAAIKSQ